MCGGNACVAWDVGGMCVMPRRSCGAVIVRLAAFAMMMRGVVRDVLRGR